MTSKIVEIIFGDISKVDGEKLFVKESDFEIPHGEDYKVAIEELNIIQKSSVNGISFLELFQYDDFSLWWFVYQSLIPKYKQITNFIDKFYELIRKHEPLSVTINDNYSNFDFIQQICKQQNIKLNYSKTSLLGFLAKQKLKHGLKKTRYEKVTKNKINKRKYLYKTKNNLIPNILNKIIFATPTVYRRDITNHVTGKSARGEYIQQNIMNLIDDKDDIIGFDLDYNFIGDHRILSERLSDSIPWLPLELLVDMNSSENHSKFLNNLMKIITSKKFQELFYFRDISLWNSLDKFFDEMFYYPYLPFYLKIVDSLCQVFQNTQPKAIFLPYETGSLALSIILAAEKFGIKTIGLQHGYIYPGNPMYHYYNFRDENSLMGFPTPTNLLVFGDYVKKMLSDIGYPIKRIMVFGNSNFFELAKIKESIKERSLYEKYKINKNKKIILFATGKLQPFYSGHGKYDYDVKIWEDLLNNFKNNDNIFLVLKPHPTEKNLSVYENLIRKLSVSNASIIDGDLFELISLSSVTITVFSSVMIDSLCLKKPVIRIKFPGDKNPIFDNSNAIITTDLDSLASKILNLFSSEQLYKNLISNSDIFVREHYGIPEKDPKNIIQKIINNEQSELGEDLND